MPPRSSAAPRRKKQQSNGLTPKQLGELESALVSDQKRALRAMERINDTLQDTTPTSARVGGDLVDMSNDAVIRENATMLGSRTDDTLRRIHAALARIRNEPSRYGVCDSCGAPIGFARLSFLPSTTTCSDHAA
jgi:RNA polymerase-binding transcription factor DksA